MKYLVRKGFALFLALIFLSGCTLFHKPEPAAPSPTPAAPLSEASPSAEPTPSAEAVIPEDTWCDDKACVAEYLSVYWHLPPNFMTKAEARKIGWKSKPLYLVKEGMAIGGDAYGNAERSLPAQYRYQECDIDTIGAKKRGAKRIVYSVEGRLIYYTPDHYETFEKLYGEE